MPVGDLATGVSVKVDDAFNVDGVKKALQEKLGLPHFVRTWVDLNRNLLEAIKLEKTRPNIHLKDMIGVYSHFLKKSTEFCGVFNAGFENISIIDIANKVAEHIPAKIIVSESNDPRSYRLCSKKLLDTGFKQKYSVNDAINELVNEFRAGNLRNEDRWYNIKTMKNLKLQ